MTKTMTALAAAATLAVAAVAVPQQAQARWGHGHGWGGGAFVGGLAAGAIVGGALASPYYYGGGPYYGYYPFTRYGPWDPYLRYDPFFYGDPYADAYGGNGGYGRGSKFGGKQHGGKLGSLFECQRSALLPCLGKSSLVELHPDDAHGFLVKPLDEGVQLEPHLLVACLGAGEDAGGQGSRRRACRRSRRRASVSYAARSRPCGRRWACRHGPSCATRRG